MACALVPATTPIPSLGCHAPQLSPSAKPYQSARRVLFVQWSPPARGWYKLNFDGSVYHDGSGRASIGGAIRDSAGRVVLAFAEPTEHSTVGIVEARAMIRGLHLALGLNLQRRRLVIEGDDLVLVQLLRGEETQTRIPIALQEEIHELLLRVRREARVSRERNQVAHTLCRQAYLCPGVWVGVVPTVVFDKAEEDRHGVLHERAVVAR